MTEPLLDLLIPGKPVGVNGLYANAAKGRRLTEAGIAYKNTVIVAIRQEYPGFTLPQGTPLKLEIVTWFPPGPAHLPLKYINHVDADGLLKALQDAICKAAGTDGTTGKNLVDDCWVWQVSSEKRLLTADTPLLAEEPGGCTHIKLYTA